MSRLSPVVLRPWGESSLPFSTGGVTAQTLKQLSLHHACGHVQAQEPGRCRPDRGQGCENRSHDPKVLWPAILPRMEETNQFLRCRIKGGNIASFMPVAQVTGEC